MTSVMSRNNLGDEMLGCCGLVRKLMVRRIAAMRVPAPRPK